MNIQSKLEEIKLSEFNDSEFDIKAKFKHLVKKSEIELNLHLHVFSCDLNKAEFYISYIIDDKELFFNLNDRFFSYNRYCHENNTFLDEDIFDSIIELLNSYEIETLEDILLQENYYDFNVHIFYSEHLELVKASLLINLCADNINIKFFNFVNAILNFDDATFETNLILIDSEIESQHFVDKLTESIITDENNILLKNHFETLKQDYIDKANNAFNILLNKKINL